MSPAGIEVAVGAVVVVDDHLLLVERGRPPAVGLWSIPGGRVAVGESLAAAVEREVAEETGLPVVCGSFLGWVERSGPEYHFLIMDFHAQPRQVEHGSLPPLAPGDDAAAAQWVSLGALHQYPLVDGLMDFLAEHGVL